MPGLRIDVDLDPKVNLAAQQNDVPVVRRVEVTNEGEAAIEAVELELRLDPEIGDPWRARIDTILPGGTHRLEQVDLPLSTSSLLARSERQGGHLVATARAAKGELASARWPVEVLAPTEWPGAGSLPELLAAFVTPNAPALGPLLTDAAARLEARTGSSSLDGYQSRDPGRVRAMAEALYEAVRARGLTYVNPPASFEQTGQKIRGPAQVLEGGMGTCLDLTVLLAALFEQVGLHPLLLVIDGHAFCGLWLNDTFLPDPAIDDGGRIAKRVRLGEALVLDSSPVAHGVPFERAVGLGLEHLAEPARFLFAVDVTRARRHRIRPLELARPDATPEPEARLARSTPEVPAAPAPVAPPVAPPRGTEAPGPRTRLDTWRDKLLDLSLRNRLLNFRETKHTVAFEHLDLPALEDALSAERGFVINASAALMGAADPRDAALHAARTGEDAARASAREDQAQGILRAAHTPAELDTRLLELYRRARTSRQESGAITLYLCLGMLEWYEAESSQQVRRAPLLLVPVELERDGRGEPFRLVHADEESRVNASLLKKLAQDFGLPALGLDRLPEDDSGVDVAWLFARFTDLVKDLRRWDVKEDCYLAELSFSKFLMWQDLVAKLDDLMQNPLVDHVLGGKGQAYELAAPLVAESELDARPAVETFTVVDADPSQLQAVLAAADGSSFVLQGPPGTGKSQTITNLIAQVLSKNQTVLFVSEKIAALEVVHDRLSRVGLGPFCLELHSHKANKRAVMAQLTQSFGAAAGEEADAWAPHAEELEAVRGQLDRFAALLGEATPFGPTVHEVVAELIGLRDVGFVELPVPEIGRIDRKRHAELEAAVEAARAAALDAGEVHGHPWAAARATEWTPARQREVEAGVAALLEAADALEPATRRAAEALGLEAPATLTDAEALGALARSLLDSPRPPKALVVGSHEDHTSRVEAWAARARARAEGWGRLGERFTERLLELDLEALRARYARWGRAFVLLAFFMLWGARRALRGAARQAELPPRGETAGLLDVALAVRREDAELAKVDGEARASLGRYWRGADTDPEEVSRVLDATGAFRRRALALTGGAPERLERLNLLFTEQADLLGEGSDGRRALEALGVALARFEAARAALRGLLDLDEARAFGAPATLEAVRARCLGWGASKDGLRDWLGFRRACAHLERIGLAPLVQTLEAGEATADELPRRFARGFLQGWWEARLEREPTLRDFRGRSHQALIDRFRALDVEAQRLAQHALVARLAARVPAPDAPGEEMGLLRRQLQLQRRHMPIRQLFARVPHTLRRLKPCVLMSPLSVAQFLDPSLERFDLVVFDEASQIPPWDAIGAIARGRQVVVVGDSKQLPPTSFFTSGGGEEDEAPDEYDVTDMESILEETIAAGVKELSLRWHYRSRHESLIAFSNHHYYGGALNTFPSRDADVEHLGVKLRPVPDGYYDRGGARTNRAEAEAVVARTLELLSGAGGRVPSVGVVTFSQAQQRLIEDLMEAAREARPELELYFTDAAAEPVFIKNLENVQGDERDVMLFSVCYGPDRAGKVTMNFGPLNREGGERRLNVAITRARERLEVFSTLRAEQIDLRRTRAVGVAHLKTFLDYAARGIVAIDAAIALEPEGEPESPFEQAILRALRAEGWRVHCQVGTSGYRIDLGVLHPEDEGAYLLGVECDGATYHSSAFARERDRLRQQVLEGLGWRLHRIWSTDWWLDPQGELVRLRAALEEARRAPPRPRAPTPAPAPAPPAPTVAAEDVVARLAEAGRSRPEGRAAFRLPAPKMLGSPEAFYEPEALAAIGARLAEVVQAAGPVDRKQAYREVMACWGLSSLGARIRGILDDALAAAPAPRRPIRVGEVLWPADLDPATWREFRVPDPEDPRTERPADEIPPAEIANAAAWVLDRAKSIDRETLVKETAFALGIARVGKRVRAAMEAGLSTLIEAGRAREQGSTILAADAEP